MSAVCVRERRETDSKRASEGVRRIAVSAFRSVPPREFGDYFSVTKCYQASCVSVMPGVTTLSPLKHHPAAILRIAFRLWHWNEDCVVELFPLSLCMQIPRNEWCQVSVYGTSMEVRE